ncbi:unnamed protein product [[Candida] boidinii]|uniref:Unnamed protein product n=1 Tax=Candida boidinii TaxID=5477 RepID=A0A9W6WF65_CANBO|nr:hypothetical protein B5S30_g2118 [[Candida] boidinii]OWB83423.1 hypothetical protein B5S33_g2053 [[Candida] boidinii]GME66978.1 unnamed protein product [[Candida] boidinii]GMG12357.1 unnamed protein product [[Candida] boidinii]
MDLRKPPVLIDTSYDDSADSLMTYAHIVDQLERIDMTDTSCEEEEEIEEDLLNSSTYSFEIDSKSTKINSSVPNSFISSTHSPLLYPNTYQLSSVVKKMLYSRQRQINELLITERDYLVSLRILKTKYIDSLATLPSSPTFIPELQECLARSIIHHESFYAELKELCSQWGNYDDDSRILNSHGSILSDSINNNHFMGPSINRNDCASSLYASITDFNANSPDLNPFNPNEALINESKVITKICELISEKSINVDLCCTYCFLYPQLIKFSESIDIEAIASKRENSLDFSSKSASNSFDGLDSESMVIMIPERHSRKTNNNNNNNNTITNNNNNNNIHNNTVYPVSKLNSNYGSVSHKRLDYSFSSLVQKPTIRMTKYKIMLESLLKYSSDYSPLLIDSIKNSLAVVSNDCIKINQSIGEYEALRFRTEQFLSYSRDSMKLLVSSNIRSFEENLGLAGLIGSFEVVWKGKNSVKHEYCGAALFNTHLMIFQINRNNSFTIKFMIPILSITEIVTGDSNFDGLITDYFNSIRILYEDHSNIYEIKLLLPNESETLTWIKNLKILKYECEKDIRDDESFSFSKLQTQVKRKQNSPSDSALYFKTIGYSNYNNMQPYFRANNNKYNFNNNTNNNNNNSSNGSNDLKASIATYCVYIIVAYYDTEPVHQTTLSNAKTIEVKKVNRLLYETKLNDLWSVEFPRSVLGKVKRTGSYFDIKKAYNPTSIGNNSNNNINSSSTTPILSSSGIFPITTAPNTILSANSLGGVSSSSIANLFNSSSNNNNNNNNNTVNIANSDNSITSISSYSGTLNDGFNGLSNFPTISNIPYTTTTHVAMSSGRSKKGYGEIINQRFNASTITTTTVTTSCESRISSQISSMATSDHEFFMLPTPKSSIDKSFNRLSYGKSHSISDLRSASNIKTSLTPVEENYLKIEDMINIQKICNEDPQIQQLEQQQQQTQKSQFRIISDQQGLITSSKKLNFLEKSTKQWSNFFKFGNKHINVN